MSCRLKLTVRLKQLRLLLLCRSGKRSIPMATESGTNFDILKRFVRKRSVTAECCDMCSIELGPDHAHLVEPATRGLVCACQACAILFSNGAETKYRRVPQTVRYLSNFELTDAQ